MAENAHETWLGKLFRRILGEPLFGESDVPSGFPASTWDIPRKVRPYLVRKRQLLNHFTAKDWDRCLTYWNYQCAICGRPRGLWHTLAQDHWIPLTHPECPGTVPHNILPLCHGEGGCNNSKGKKLPLVWLQEKLGKRRAAKKLAEIQAYFTWVESQRLGCPACGRHITYHEGELHCTHCLSMWDEAAAAQLIKCPSCGCLMADTDGGYYCPRCEDFWHTAQILGIEWCPGCTTGILDWLSDGAYWKCRKCGAEWEDEGAT